LKPTNTQIRALGLCLAAILLFTIFKILKYNLCYYTTDLFGCLQVSRSWVQGFPFLWENRYGQTSAFHINFIAVIFTPFSVLMGARGLFVEHAIILFSATAWFVLSKEQFIKENFPVCFSIIVILMLGPYSFWIFDNPYLGWFFDLLFLPFSLMFALALRSGKKTGIILTGILLVITKEDGAVIACVIMLYAAIVNHSLDSRGESLFKKLALITVFWMTVLALLFVFLYAWNDFKTARINSAFNTFNRLDLAAKTIYLKLVFTAFAWMIIPLLAFFALFFRLRNLVLLCILLLPVITIGLISGFYYAPNEIFSLTWTARFCEVLGVIVAAAVLSMRKEMMHRSVTAFFRNNSRLAFLILLMFCLQVISLQAARNYKFIPVVVAIFRSDLAASVTAGNIQTLKCVSEKIPDSCVVVLPEYYYNLFESHQLAWFDHLENAPHKPDLVVFDNVRYYEENKLHFPGYVTVRVNDIYMLTPANSPFDLKACAY
jgi:hypothetical protein